MTTNPTDATPPTPENSALSRVTRGAKSSSADGATGHTNATGSMLRAPSSDATGRPSESACGETRGPCRGTDHDTGSGTGHDADRSASGGVSGGEARGAIEGVRGGAGRGANDGAGRRVGGVVVVDAMGGDFGVGVVVAGALGAWREFGVPVVLVGRAEAVERELRRRGGAGEVGVRHADEVVPMAETVARRGSSLLVGCELARREGAPFVSAGSTGAVVACAVRTFGRREGVLRPALAVAIPTPSGATVLVDAGGTADPSAEMLAQFATLGAEYARRVLGVRDPSVGLLSIGAEPGKGNRLAREAARLLPEMPVRFHGNVEGHDVPAGTVDVVVTDGFTGNVVLKNIEGCVRTTLGLVARAGLTDTGPLDEVARLYSADTHGGAALLGLDGTVVVAHGSSGPAAIARACVMARDLGTGP